MSPLMSNNPTTVGPKKCSIAEAQVKDLKIGIMSMLEEMNGLIKETYENTNRQ